MLGNLGENLTNTMKKLVGMSVIDKKTIKEVVKDIQRALIQSDVNIKLVLELSKKIETRALEEEPPKGITPREHVITIIYEEMVNLLGSEAAGLDINDRPYKILFLGLQGSGKTTTIGKLCRYLQKKGFNPAVVCTDTWRPAAYEQLRQLTEEMDVPLYGDPNNKDALDLAKKGLEEFKNRKVIIFDTAGRHKEEADLIAEMDELDNIINPNEAILVIDGTIGQQAGEQARAFSQATDIGSIIITKLDGSAKGGGAMSAVAETGAPIKFIGTGERIDDFELFDPERFISRLLGMGDIKSLIDICSIAADCDRDALLIQVRKDGPACHLGTESCFEYPLFIQEEAFSFDELYKLLLNRKELLPEGSYTSYLFQKGIDKILKKVGEECTEVIIAGKAGDRAETIYEVADLAYHVLVMMVELGIKPEEIRRELASRHIIDHKVKQEKMT